LMKQKYIFNVFSVDSFLIEYALEEVKMIWLIKMCYFSFIIIFNVFSTELFNEYYINKLFWILSWWFLYII
jgi:hypothetical protein